MNTITRNLVIKAILVFFAFSIGADDFRDAETVVKGRGIRLEFVSYVSLGGGAGFTTAWEGFPALDAALGLQIAPWLAIGGFASISLLSDLEDFAPGVSVADQKNSYAAPSGIEILFIPWSRNIIHPLLRITLGGVTVGHLEDQDGEKGLETAIEERFFFATFALGAEINLFRHMRIYAQAGGRYVANHEVLGIPNGGLSGLELRLGLRLLWRTVID